MSDAEYILELEAAIDDIDVHATPIAQNDDGYVEVGYTVTVGAIHRALGVLRNRSRASRINQGRERSLADDPAACNHTKLIETIRTWSQAYPESVFPEPPAGEHGQTIDTCSARALRHAFGVLDGLLAARETDPKDDPSTHKFSENCGVMEGTDHCWLCGKGRSLHPAQKETE